MKGIIAGGSPQTVEAGAEILRLGGNAVDAAVAASFASYLGEPILTSPSGGGFATVYAPGQTPVVYDFFCTTPGLGDDRRGPGMDFTPVTVQYESGTSVYHVGRASSAVPGNIAGLAQLLEEQGTLPLVTVLEPAIRLGRDGYALSANQAYLIKLVDVILAYDPGCASVFAPEGHLLGAGEHFRNTRLAETLARMAADGLQTFYHGALAQEIAADQEAHGGLITTTDLAAYRVIKRAPLRFDYKGYTVYTNPPPSAGGILIAYMMRLFSRAGLSGMAHHDTRHVALVAEVMRQTNIAHFRDRPEDMPDPANWAAWLSDEHQRADWQAVMAALQANGQRHSPAEPPTTPSTTQISVIDAAGMAVSLTTTAGETAGYLVGETGIVANNILGEGELSPDGFHTWQPGIRLASMMAPTIVADDTGARVVLGSGGAARLRSAIFHLMSNVLDWDMALADAVAAPRVHMENDILDLEGGIAPAVADQLANAGYTVSRWPGINFYFGGTHAILRSREGQLQGAGDPRRGGKVIAVE